jgi:hypothetical protein
MPESWRPTAQPRPAPTAKPDPGVVTWYAADGTRVPVTNTSDGLQTAVARGLLPERPLRVEPQFGPDDK